MGSASSLQIAVSTVLTETKTTHPKVVRMLGGLGGLWKGREG